jgi:hypothetical protein
VIASPLPVSYLWIASCAKMSSHRGVKILKFLGPHLLKMVEDAVTKWNPDIPEGMMRQFALDIDMLRHKFRAVETNHEFMIDAVDKLKTAKDVNDLMHIRDCVLEFSETIYLEALVKSVRSLVKGDWTGLYEAETELAKYVKNFPNSFKISREDLPATRAGSKIIDDAILALSRIMPKRKLAESGTLVLRDVLPVVHHGVSSDDILEITKHLSGLYNISIHGGVMTHKTAVLKPKVDYVDITELSEIYKKDLTGVTVYELMMLEPPSVWIAEDTNISPKSILNKLLGAAVTSLSTTVTDLFIFLSMILEKSRVPIEELIMEVRTGPWSAIEDGMVFSVPTLLYEVVRESCSGPDAIEEDFNLMLEFLMFMKLHRDQFDDSVFQKIDDNALRGFRVNKKPRRNLSDKLKEKNTEPSAPDLSDVVDEDFESIAMRFLAAVENLPSNRQPTGLMASVIKGMRRAIDG